MNSQSLISLAVTHSLGTIVILIRPLVAVTALAAVASIVGHLASRVQMPQDDEFHSCVILLLAPCIYDSHS